MLLKMNMKSTSSKLPNQPNKPKSQNSVYKGQIKSEWIYEIINFPKNLKDFCPMYCKISLGRDPSNFWGHFLEIDDFINSF